MMDRDTHCIQGELFEYLPAPTATEFPVGHMAAVDATGLLHLAADAEGLVVVGRIERGLRHGRVTVRRGVFNWEKAAATPPTAANLGQFVYVADSETVSVAAGVNGIVAGVLLKVDDFAWVDTGFVRKDLDPAAAG
ncbi:hypothetical protein [Megalodesulfovibrio gigas]|uniref:DUF2190 family protein n=1 Tax=Megalodesulfovibrio gigas (strain ATCC 19364 / DSM 1382 / NCIMB 9332 / VKM B-1759) TaxID=1121448 RepID=T2GD90_MEGG1|nr:hypothetical protein [Megalodesulfovibrio gigas]AGW14129.1 hypothetical protein DGI_2377 [Megalodesulfovibrio gigas DSM 1382 = ATCC 19364]